MESDAVSSWCPENCLWEVWGNYPHNHPHNILKLVAEHRRAAYIIPIFNYDLHAWTCNLRYHGYCLLIHILSSFSLKILHICSCCAVCLVTQLCATLCNPMNGSPPGSSVMGILQGRILEWVAMPSPRGSSQPRDQTQVFHTAGGLLMSEPPGKPKNNGVGSLSLLHIYASIHIWIHIILHYSRYVS